jgi:hypothetical protein
VARQLSLRERIAERRSGELPLVTEETRHPAVRPLLQEFHPGCRQNARSRGDHDRGPPPAP